MRPYKVEHFVEGSNTPEDLFELVGILVHSGTAESGHYYSYIRERPSASDKEPWVEFNDDCVTSWDPDTMESNCFGGVDYHDHNGIQYDKNYSAYMLFYQRCSTLDSQKQALAKSGMPSPVRITLPSDISNHIAFQNEILMRQFCLYDPSQAAFVIKMLSNIKQINKGQCSASHDLEKLAIVSSLNFLDQVAARTKDVPDFLNLIGTLKDLCRGCAACSRDFLEWFVDKPFAVRQLILKNPEFLVRNEISVSILLALAKLKEDLPSVYGPIDDENNNDDAAGGQHLDVLEKVVKVLSEQWNYFQTNTRAWPDYFGLLLGIANMGDVEAAVLLDSSYLQRCLEVITADSVMPLTQQYQRLLTIVAKRTTGNRTVSYDAIIDLLDRLIQACDLTLEPIADDELRLDCAIDNNPIPVRECEKSSLIQFWTKNNCNILTQKLLQLHQSYGSSRNIITILLHSLGHFDSQIYEAICFGLHKSINCESFVRGALTYCEHSGKSNGIPSMIQGAARAVDGAENPDGHAFLRFFKDVTLLDSNRNDIPKEDIIKWVRQTAPLWAPALLNNYDPFVRDGTEKYLEQLLFEYVPASGSKSNEDENHLSSVGRKLGYACLDYLNRTYIDQHQQAISASLGNIERVLESCSAYISAEEKFYEKKLDLIDQLNLNTVDEIEEASG